LLDETACGVSRLAVWWRQPDHYDWLTGYLASRDLQKFIRLMVGATTATLGAITLAMTWSPAGPDRAVAYIAVLLSVAWCLAMVLLWARRWPTRRQSIFFAVTTVACTAVVGLSYSDALFGLIACMTFAVLAGYVAFFHRATLLLLTLAVAAATTLALAIKLSASSGDVVGAACVFVGIAVVLISVPLASHALAHFLGVDVMDSDFDPLCGVLNRRGFYRSAGHLVATDTPAADRCIAVTMVDLDHFKNVNDTYGHPLGDMALIAVGNVLRHHSGDSAVVARVGGEEFCIADIVCDDQIKRWAEAVRNAIAAMPFGITASVGVARLPLKSVSVLSYGTIDSLIAIADAAMYDAKRSGGNRIREVIAT
jgi:diguanylate cyclase (GGDEF)-like protein